MTLVRLDPSGRLTHLVVVPPATAAATAAALAPDWPALLVRAGFDPSAWTPTTPQRNPPVFANARAAWEGMWPNARDLRVRLEAAALDGKPVYFEAVFPWTPPPRTPSPLLTPAEAAMIVALFLVARRNIRAGRGDRRGAFRLSAFVFTTMLVSWFFGESHVATLWEVALIVMAVSWALLAAGLCWVAYLAAEPLLRRRWPEVLVSWARVLAGEFRDPLVGRDVLVGCATGSIIAALAILGFLLPAWLDLPDGLVFADVYGIAYGVQSVVPLLVWRAAQAVVASLGCVFLLLLLRLALRSSWAAVATFVLASALLTFTGFTDPWLTAFMTIVLSGVFALLIVRFGLLAAVIQFYVWGLFVFFPITADLDAWYAGSGMAALFVLTLIALFGFTTSQRGPRVLDRKFSGTLRTS
jgi:serine/threonine-protein kinase